MLAEARKPAESGSGTSEWARQRVAVVEVARVIRMLWRALKN
jgi:hypothetical protein